MRRRFFYLAVSSDYIGIPNNEIWYTSVYNNVVEPSDINAFTTSIISNTYSNGKGVIVFANSVTSIGNAAFWFCSGLTSVTIPNSVKSIGLRAFDSCFALTSVTIGTGVTIIENYAFYFCSGLTSVTIPNSVKSIGYGVFYYCDGLTSVTIGNSVESIGEYAFWFCSGLTSVTCEAIIPPMIESNTFKEVSTSIPVYVPTESVDAYKSAQYWSNFTNIQAIS